MPYQLYLRAVLATNRTSGARLVMSGVFETALRHKVGDTIDFGRSRYRATAIRRDDLGITIVDCEPHQALPGDVDVVVPSLRASNLRPRVFD